MDAGEKNIKQKIICLLILYLLVIINYEIFVLNITFRSWIWSPGIYLSP